jgi:hypothetical protein
VYAITTAGRSSLGIMRGDTLREIVIKPDPFDLAMSRLDPSMLDDLDGLLQARLVTLRTTLEQTIAHTASIEKYLTFGERIVMQHKVERLRAEVRWHEYLYSQLPDIITDELNREVPRP